MKGRPSVGEVVALTREIDALKAEIVTHQKRFEESMRLLQDCQALTLRIQAENARIQEARSSR